jgi:hypothetical protein
MTELGRMNTPRSETCARISNFTLKERTLKRSNLDEFVQCFHAENRHERKDSERFKGFAYDELSKRDKVNLDIFWLRDESLEDSANLPDPDGGSQGGGPHWGEP